MVLGNIDTDMVVDRLTRGAFVGVGAFAGRFAENFIEDNTGVADMGVLAGELVIGAGLSLGADSAFNPRRQAMLNDAVEFVGYGMQGNAWSNLADAIQTGARTDQVVTVRAQGDGQSSLSASSDQQDRATVNAEVG